MSVRRVLLVAAAGLAGCDQGTLTVSVTDAPIDEAVAVVIQFDGVEIERSTGEREFFEIAPPRNVDLVELADGDSLALLDEAELEEGTYSAVRLAINATGSGADSYVETASERRGLQLADADAARLRIGGSFTIEQGEALALTVDWDLRKSIHAPASASAPYDLVPSLRLIEDADAGTLTGAVQGSLAGAAGCTPAVYLFRGRDRTPDDESPASSTAPYASAVVRSNGSAFAYTIGFLPAGSYTAAFTCDAGADDPEREDALVFDAAENVAVTVGATTVQDF